MKSVHQKENFSATQNACNLCAPLGAALVFKGIANAMPLLHGSQGCSTYIRRYMISHFKEPLDIACSNFGEETAIFGGGANLKLAIDNIRHQYDPELIGVATTCLSETIGDDVPMFINAYQDGCRDEALPALVHVSTPSYQGTHMQGFHGAVRALIKTLARYTGACGTPSINLFPGMMSPSDLRYLKAVMNDFDLDCTLVPDYSDTLNGSLWTEYQQIPGGRHPSGCAASLGRCHDQHRVWSGPGGRERDGRHLAEGAFRRTASSNRASHRHPPERSIFRIAFHDQRPAGSQHPYRPARPPAGCHGRRPQTSQLGCALPCSVKKTWWPDWPLSAEKLELFPFCAPPAAATGRFAQALRSVVPETCHDRMQIMEDVDFVTIEKTLEMIGVDLLIGHSKGCTMSRRLKRPLIRVGFPVHDRVDGSRLLHLGYRGAQQLFDRIANTLIEMKQERSDVGYTYM